MKTHHFSFVRTCGFIVLAAILCSAQQPEASVRSLKEQIAKLEAIDRDSVTSDDVKILNNRFLTERRRQLHTALQQRIETLRKYQVAVKASLTTQENKIVEDSITELEKDLQDVERDLNASGAGVQPANPASTTASGLRNQPVGTATVSPFVSNSVVKSASPQKVTPVSATSCSGSTSPYPDAPPILKGAVEDIADDIISGAQKPADAISFRFPDTFFYTVAHAVSPAADVSIASIKALKAYQYLGETVRTDKQIGAAAKGAGTTSTIEKPGFSRLLGFAVESGAITQEVGATSFTLSTSPYMLYTFSNGGDTAANYQRSGVLNRIGVSATFDLKDQNNVLANATRNQLSEWSIKARLLGDRSTRSKAFQDFWRKPDGPQAAIEKRLVALTRGFKATLPGFAEAKPDFDPFINVDDDIGSVVDAVTKGGSYTVASSENKKKLLSNAILCVLRDEVYNPIANNSFPVSQQKRDEINLQIVPAIAASLRNIESVRKLLDDKLAEFQKGPLATFSYVNHRRPIGSDYSEAKLLYQHEGALLQPMKLVANFGLSLYNKPNPVLNQQKVRDISAGLSFEGQSTSPLLKSTADLSKITYAFTGSYQRTFENRRVAGRKADLGAFQFKVELPIFAGMALPLSVTYANATEQQRKSHVRFNFGMGLDADKLFSIMQLLK